MLLLAIIALRWSPMISVPREYTVVLPWSNFLLTTCVALLVAYLMAWSFARGTSPAALWMGAGLLILGLASVMAGIKVAGQKPDAGVATYNIAACIAGLCQVLGAVQAFLPVRESPRPRRYLTILLAYGAGVGVLAVVSVLSVRGALPDFWVGHSTPMRDVVLGTAAGQFLLAGVLVMMLHRSAQGAFLYWYAMGLLLLGIGLGGVLMIRDLNSALAWVARGAQYVGGLYMLWAVVTLRRSARWQLPLEQELLHAQDRYRTLFDATDEGFCVMEILFDENGEGIDHRFLEVNPAFERHTGLVNAVDKRARELVPDLEPRWAERYGRIARSQHRERFIDHSEAMDRWFEVDAFPVDDPQLHHVALLFTDITARKRSEETLREANREKSLILDNISTGVAFHDTDHRLVWANQTYLEATGLSLSDVAGRTCYTCWGLDRACLNCPVVAALESGQPQENELTPENQPHWPPDQGSWLVRAAPVRDSDGAIIGAIEVAHNITARKAAEQALRESRQTLRMALESADMGDWQYTFADSICVLSERAQSLYGLRAPRWVHDEPGVRDVIHEEDIPGMWRGVREACDPSGDGRYNVEYRVRRPEGGWRWLRMWGTVQFEDRAGQRVPTRMVGASRDITPEKQTTEVLEQRVAERTAEVQQQADRLRALASQLSQAEHRERKRLAKILHDHIQQLIVGARMQLEWLKHAPKPERVLPTVQGVDSILHEALQASRDLTMDLSPPILHEAGLVGGLNWLAARMQEKNQFTVNLHASNTAEPATEETRLLLFECARELLFNAVKHAGVPSADVTLLRTKDHHVRLLVSDRGKGFDPMQIKAQQAQKASFGLFSIQERLAYVGGRMEMETAPGRGTRITLSVPIGSAPATAPTNAARATTVEAGGNIEIRRKADVLRVLIVDDHKILRDGLRGLLQFESDLEVVGEATDGPSAVELTAQLVPDVIIMDVNLSGEIDGVETTRRILAANPQVRVIGLSMHSESAVARAMREAGATAYLNKGGPAEDLIATIRACRGPQASGDDGVSL